MKSSYRVRYLLGAPIIVLGGLAATFWVPRAVSYGNQVKHWAHQFEHSSQPVTVEVAFLPFYVDGEKLGKLHTVVIQRDRPGAVDSLRVTVHLTHGEDAARLGACKLVLTDMDNVEPGTLKHMVTCASDSVGLLPFGRVSFGKQEVPLFVEGDRTMCDALDPTERAACAAHEGERIRAEVQAEIRQNIRRNIRQNIQRARDEVRVHRE